MGVVEREQPLLQTSSSSEKKYLLQRWSEKWGEFVDVKEPEEVKDGDKLSAVPKQL